MSGHNTIDNLFNALNHANQIDNLHSCFASDAILHLASGKTIEGADSITTRVKELFSTLDLFERAAKQVIIQSKADGDYIAVRSHTKITQSGKHAEFNDITMLRVNDQEKIVDLWQGAATFNHLFMS